MYIQKVNRIVFSSMKEVGEIVFTAREICSRADFDPNKPMGNVGNRFDMFWIGAWMPSVNGGLGEFLGWIVVTPRWDEGDEEFDLTMQALEIPGIEYRMAFLRAAEEWFKKQSEYCVQRHWVKTNILAKI